MVGARILGRPSLAVEDDRLIAVTAAVELVEGRTTCWLHAIEDGVRDPRHREREMYVSCPMP